MHQTDLFWFIPKLLGFATLLIPQIQNFSFEKGKSAFLKCLTGIYATPASSLPRKETLPGPRPHTAAPTPRAGCAPQAPAAPARRVSHTGTLSPLSDPGRTLGTQGVLPSGFASEWGWETGA